MNAVFERDFIRLSTSKRFLWMRAGLALGIAAWTGFHLLGAYGTSSYEGIASSVMRGAVGIGLVLLLLATPGSFATVLVHARAQNTLAVLLSTPLTPFQLAWGAYVARASTLSVFVLATLPPIALGLAFGGLHVLQIASAMFAVLSATLFVAAPAFVVSAFARRTGAAVVSSYLAAAATLTGLAAAAWLLGKQPGASPASGAAISPMHAAALSLDARGNPVLLLQNCSILLCLALFVSVGAILLATLRLRQEARGDLEHSSSLREGRPLRPLRHENPILDRELALGAGKARGASRTLLAMLVATEIVYALAVMWTGDRMSIPLFSGFLVFQMALILLASAAAGATSLAAEKETGALDLIRVTPLSPAQIVRGKLAGLLRAQLPCLAVPLVHLLWGVLVRPPGGAAWFRDGVTGILSPFAIPVVAISGLVVVSTWAVFGMSQSLDQRDPHRAVVRTMAALGIVGVVIAAQFGFVIWSALKGGDNYVSATTAFGGNPIAAILGGAAALRVGGSSAENTVEPPPTGAQTAGGLFACAIWLALHTGAALFVYRRLVALYRTRFEG